LERGVLIERREFIATPEHLRSGAKIVRIFRTLEISVKAVKLNAGAKIPPKTEVLLAFTKLGGYF